MAYTFDGNNPLEGTTRVDNGDFYQVILDHFDAIAQNFAGTSFPGDPVLGQPCIRTDKGANSGVLYIYSGNLNLGDNGWLDWSAYSRYYQHKKFASIEVTQADQEINVRGRSRIKIEGSGFSVANFIYPNEGNELIIIATGAVTIKSSSSTTLASFPQTMIQLKDNANFVMASGNILTLLNISTNFSTPMWVETDRRTT